MKIPGLLVVAASLGVAAADPLPLIPRPVSLQTGEGTFAFSAETAIRHNRQLASEAKLFAADLAKLTGREPKLVAKEQRIALPSEILLDLEPASDLPASGYKLEITPKSVHVIGKDAAGAYYGTRTLMQLLPVKGSEVWATTKAAPLPVLTITDNPRLGWRGMHLDVGRHFFPVEDIKKYIDWLAFHKLNVLHWHLSEDQGWRIEIKKWPKLTTVGAWRDSTPPYGNRGGSDGKRYGGFYTQEQAKEIVAYAAARHVTVVPEIDMPGHMSAAVTAYPELGNNDVPGFNPKVITHWGVFDDTLAPTEQTFQFVDDVFTELCAIFPSTYIHMGGDEAPKTQWEQSPRVKELMKKENLKNSHEVQSYFVKRVEKILEKKGRKLIGWDEIREGGLSPSAAVMSWRGEQGGIDSAKEGHDVVMAASGFLYLDSYQEPKEEALAKGLDHEAIGGFLPIQKVYNYDPVPKELSATEAKHVLGVQGQAWTEYMKTYDKVEYQVFPRIAALSEIAWSPKEGKNFEDFRKRLDGVLKIYDAAGVNHGPVYAEPKREARDGAELSSSIGAYQNHWPELAYDGRPNTYFWGDRDLKADDHFTLKLKAATAAESTVTAATGAKGGENSDRLENGVLECSADGSQWSEVAKFQNGAASGKLPAGTSQVRIRVTAPQKNWLIVQDIDIK